MAWKLTKDMARAGNPHLKLARKGHNGRGSKRSGLENGRGRSQFWLPTTRKPALAVLGNDHTTGCVPVIGGHSWPLQFIFQSENTTLLFPKPELCVTIQRP